MNFVFELKYTSSTFGDVKNTSFSEYGYKYVQTLGWVWAGGGGGGGGGGGKPRPRTRSSTALLLPIE